MKEEKSLQTVFIIPAGKYLFDSKENDDGYHVFFLNNASFAEHMYRNISTVVAFNVEKAKDIREAIALDAARAAKILAGNIFAKDLVHLENISFLSEMVTRGEKAEIDPALKRKYTSFPSLEKDLERAEFFTRRFSSGAYFL